MYKRIAGAGLTLLALMAILKLTLWPYTFHFHALGWRQYLGRFEHIPSAMLDCPENIVLFIPFGVGLALAFEEKIVSIRPRALVILLLGFVLSAGIESLQIFIPGRTPNLSDIISNSLGGLTGLGLVEAWRVRNRIPGQIRTRIVRWDVRIVSAFYLLILLLLTWVLMNGLRPAFWDASYRLGLGNETTGDWAWNGTLRDLVLVGTGITKSQAEQFLQNRVPAFLENRLAAEYSLTSNEGLKDRTGHSPQFLPRGELPRFVESGVVLTRNSWLRTSRSLSDFVEAVNRSREYTIAATASTPKPHQWEGPRLISLSANDEHTDVMISHYRNEIEFRWRAPLTGQGTSPQLYFPDAFPSMQPFRFVVTQRKNTISFYTSFGTAMEIFLGPEVGLSAFLTQDSQWLVEATPTAFWPTATLFALVFYAPAGAYFRFWFRFVKNTDATAFSGVCWLLLPPLVAESLVSLYGERGVRLSYIGLGVLTGLLGFILAGPWRRAGG